MSPAAAANKTQNKAMNESSIIPKDIKTEADLNEWMTYYYLHPQPDLTPKAIFF